MQGKMVGFHWIDAAIIIAYLLVLSGVGLYFSTRKMAIGDYFRAGKGMAWLPVGLSLMAALNSGIDFVQQPLAAYNYGILIFMSFVTWIMVYPYVSRVTLPFYKRLDVYSAYEYLERRFDVRVRSLGAVIFMLWRLAWMGVALYIPCFAINAATGGALPIVPTIIVLGAVVTFYTVLGGIKAVIWTDVIQFCIMFTGLAVTLYVIFSRLGGVQEILSAAHAGGRLSLVSHGEAAGGGTLEQVRLFLRADVTMIGLIIAVAVSRFTSFTTDQITIQRFQTTRSVADSKRAFAINAVTDTIWMGVLVFIGLALFAYIKPDSLPAGVSVDQIVPYFMRTAFPVGLLGLVIAAIFAASLSSIDSAINACSSIVVVDFYNRLILKRARPTDDLSDQEQRSQLRVSRVATLVCGIAMIVVASNVGSLGDLYTAANKTIGAFTGPLFGIFILGMFTRRATGVCTLLGGFVGLVVGPWMAFRSGLSFTWAPPSGCLATILVGYGLSLLTADGSAKSLTFRRVMAEEPSN